LRNRTLFRYLALGVVKMNLLEYFETLSDEEFERDIQKRIDHIAIISARLGMKKKKVK
jgi:hypothetical protein